MKFNIITLGCKVNSYESNYVRQSLENNGFSFCEDNYQTDIIIINTCSVTDTSDKKSLKTVRRARRENPNAILVVMGCSTQYNSDLYNNLGINILLGNKDKSKVCELINNYIKNKEDYCYITKERNLPFEDMMIDKFDQVRAYIKVQDGCNNFCSYCIIPYVRGDIRCKEFNKVICEAKHIVKNGYKELVLTGIHTGSYFSDGKDLTDLINELAKIDGLERIRLSSVEITELNDKFMQMLKTNSKFCHHLHIPLQSGSNEILKRMNRKYDTKYYEDKINQIRSIIPDISITTDVIVGFNYETQKLFEETYNFCKMINFSKIHCFPFSKREGTAASLMPMEVSEKEKKERCLNLIDLSNKLEKDYYNKFVGTKRKVLIEKVKDNVSYGHTSNYLMVIVNKKCEVGTIVEETIS